MICGHRMVHASSRGDEAVMTHRDVELKLGAIHHSFSCYSAHAVYQETREYIAGLLPDDFAYIVKRLRRRDTDAV